MLYTYIYIYIFFFFLEHSIARSFQKNELSPKTGPKNELSYSCKCSCSRPEVAYIRLLLCCCLYAGMIVCHVHLFIIDHELDRWLRLDRLQCANWLAKSVLLLSSRPDPYKNKTKLHQTYVYIYFDAHPGGEKKHQSPTPKMHAALKWRKPSFQLLVI
jgi:hypothetical protein